MDMISYYSLDFAHLCALYASLSVCLTNSLTVSMSSMFRRVAYLPTDSGIYTMVRKNVTYASRPHFVDLCVLGYLPKQPKQQIQK